MSGDQRTLDVATLRVPGARADDAPAAVPRDRYYLMVFGEESSTSFSLPRTGTVLIGRAPESHLRIDDHGVSRRHAALTMADGEARIADLGSHNGVWIGDERIVASRVLVSGDVVTIGGATLVYHARGGPRPGRRALEFGALRQRLAEECERAGHFSRELAVIVVLVDDGLRAAVASALDRVLRGCDVVGVDAAGDLVILLPETGGAAAPIAASAVLEGAQALDPGARVGFAAHPLDGDADALLAGARAAASQAPPGSAAAAADACRILRIGEAEVVVAEPAMHRLYAVAERIAAADLPVLVTGETGTGKELVAAAIHAMSARRRGPFVVMSCAALPEHLLESELFGCAAGAYPGCGPERPGRLEAAAGGTLFLDEIGELSPAAQAKLLRAIEAGRVVRLGEHHERALDLRIVAATHHPIDDEAETGAFRRDLYFRLSGARLWLPPLRDRPRELPILAQHLLAAARRAIGGGPMGISPAAMRVLAAHPWPGNVRELRNLMVYVAAAYAGDTLLVEHLRDRLPAAVGAPTISTRPEAPTTTATSPTSAEPGPDAPPTFRPLEDEIRELEIDRISAALAATRGNQTRAAELIGMPLRTFVNKLKRYGLGADRRP